MCLVARIEIGAIKDASNVSEAILTLQLQRLTLAIKSSDINGKIAQ